VEYRPHDAAIALMTQMLPAKATLTHPEPHTTQGLCHRKEGLAVVLLMLLLLLLLPAPPSLNALP